MSRESVRGPTIALGRPACSFKSTAVPSRCSRSVAPTSCWGAADDPASHTSAVSRLYEQGRQSFHSPPVQGVFGNTLGAAVKQGRDKMPRHRLAVAIRDSASRLPSNTVRRVPPVSRILLALRASTTNRSTSANSTGCAQRRRHRWRALLPLPLRVDSLKEGLRGVLQEQDAICEVGTPLWRIPTRGPHRPRHMDTQNQDKVNRCRCSIVRASSQYSTHRAL